MGHRTAQPSAFIGIGTGRCGTVSLARIIGACAHTSVTHEGEEFRSPWEKPDTAALDRFVEHVRRDRRAGLVTGDVAFYWLPHVERLRSELPDLKVICLKRRRQDTIRSFLHKCPGFSLLRPQDRPFNPLWWDQMPTIDAPTVEDAWGRYWDQYYQAAEAIPGVTIVRTEDLDHDATITAVFDVLDINPGDRAFLPDRRFNTAAETHLTLPIGAPNA